MIGVLVDFDRCELSFTRNRDITYRVAFAAIAAGTWRVCLCVRMFVCAQPT